MYIKKNEKGWNKIRNVTNKGIAREEFHNLIYSNRQVLLKHKI